MSIELAVRPLVAISVKGSLAFLKKTLEDYIMTVAEGFLKSFQVKIKSPSCLFRLSMIRNCLSHHKVIKRIIIELGS